MERRFVFSSNIRSIGFDRGEQLLEIEFFTGGVYQYRDVPESVYDELINAPSKGKYYQHRIKECFPYLRVAEVASD